MKRYKSKYKENKLTQIIGFLVLTMADLMTQLNQIEKAATFII